MLLGGLTCEDVSRIVAECAGRSPMPALTDPRAHARALELARRRGIDQRLRAELAEPPEIPTLPYSGFREFRRTGNRTHHQARLGWRGGQIARASMACMLGIDRIEYLQDLLWAECESSWWIMPAHEGPGQWIDLRAAEAAWRYAAILAMLADRIDDEVRDRVHAEIRRRVFEAYLDRASDLWWYTTTNNWNAVCHGGIAMAAMLIETDPDRLAPILCRALESLPHFLDGFTDDGGCTEGPSYWRYGFGWYVKLAAGLHDFSGGRIDIMAGEKIARICRYPMAANLADAQDVTFADAHSGPMSLETAMGINRFCEVPELYSLCRFDEDGSPAVGSLWELLHYDGRELPRVADRGDRHLGELGFAKVRAGGTTVAAKGGHNAEHHNHNDVGSFLVHRGATQLLCDPGGPIYSARTFSDRRYESVFCNSFGHSVPLVSGQMQSSGRRFCGTLTVEGLNGDGAKLLRIEMGGAYPDQAGLERLSRTIELSADGRAVTIADAFAFATPPAALEEAFVTFCPAAVGADGAVAIGSESDGTAVLRAVDTPGEFQVAELRAESEAEARGRELLRRITFTPAEVGDELTLRFELRMA